MLPLNSDRSRPPPILQHPRALPLQRLYISLHADQYMLWSGNSVPFTNSLNSTTVALPSTFPAATYDRSVVLAGLRGDYAKKIAFSLGVSTLSDTNLNIIMAVGNLNSLYTVSVYVVLVNATSDWTWLV